MKLKGEKAGSGSAHWWDSFWFWTAVTVGMVLLVYAPVRHFDQPVWDDRVHITDNPLVVVGVEALKEPGYWARLLAQTVNGTFIPLTVLTWAIEHAVFGPGALAAAHVINVLLHLIVCCLAGRLLFALGAAPIEAGAAMLLFGVHPMHVESVAWATQRKDVLYAVFYLWSVVSFVRYLSHRRAGDLVIAVASGVLSMLAKPMALSLPLIWGITAWFTNKPFDKKTAGAVGGLGVVLSGLGWLTYKQFMRLPQWGSWKAAAVSVWVWVWCFAFYWRSFFWPVGLSPHYVIPQPVDGTNPSYWSAAVITAAVIGYAFFVKDRVFRFALVWFVGSVFFLLRWDIGYDITPVADRFMYLASLPLCWWVVRAVHGIVRRGGCFWKDCPVAAGVCFVWLVLFLAAGARTMVLRWADEERLWSYAVVRHPRDAYAHFSLGQVLMQKGLVDQAMDHYQKAVALQPTWVRPMNNLAEILIRRGETDKALSLLNNAVQQDPSYTPARVNLAGALMQAGRFDEAFKVVEDGLARNRDQGLLWLVRGDVMMHRGRLDEAWADYHRAYTLLGEQSRVLNRLAAVLIQQGRYGEAAGMLERVLVIDPMNPAARHNQDLLRRLQEREGAVNEPNEERGLGDSLRPSAEAPHESVTGGKAPFSVRHDKGSAAVQDKALIENPAASQGGAFFLPPVRGKRTR